MQLMGENTVSNLFFTSDTHYFHKNIIKYSNRPFEDVQEMNQALIDNWNKVVTPKDQVWHLGDFSFGNYEQTKNVLRQLNGHKNFIWGNHDQVFEKDTSLLGAFDSVQHYKELRWNGQKIVLCHYPILSWNGAHRGSWMLHGHCHTSVDYLNIKTIRLDVGVDGHNYTPISFEEVNKIMKNKSYDAVDHHTER